MKKLIGVVAVVLGLSACVQQSPAQPEDLKLKQAYSACIQATEGSPERLVPCKAVLKVLKQEKAHQAFAEKENVRVLDYQRCIDAAHTGNGQVYASQCGKLWQEIRNNN
ncbi:ybfN-like lipofamily protein [Yersinia ruckeri]|uniref:ChiQ/YbfN family lipoprotein n=1 Tax=Yersinia ruckeri TaxID=29486 RepID=UPI0005ACE423|nr:ChiQ/YbfN family lipoprotein [Yersinia ruckeri]AJI94103.1 ybfN-like lipofamily protein [Yersinia ruckeri]MCW6569237.1 ChiQ/YbfN family lipoprotein [Yersinia ruckeri]